MKRQASISSFFTKKTVEKKSKPSTTPTSAGPTPTPAGPSDDEIKRLHEQFEKKFGALDQERVEKRKRVESVMTNPTMAQKFTPLETQVVDLKARYPGCLLLVEVGYKFRFFGEDAIIASRVLHIANFIDRNFFVASIPVHRLDIHVKRYLIILFIGSWLFNMI